MKKVLFIISIAMVILLSNCQPSQNVQIQKENEKQRMEHFTPPADGKITDKQINIYINVAKALNKAILEQVMEMNNFYERYGISGKEELDKIKDDKKAMHKWKQLMSDWETKEKNIYKKYKMSSEEFDWIASALIDNKNVAAQKKIEEALEDTTDLGNR